MRVRAEVRLLPGLFEAVGEPQTDVEFQGSTVQDLLDRFVELHGRKARDAIYEPRGGISPEVQILVNGRDWVRHDDLGRPLADGDHVKICLLLGGG